MAHLCPPKRRGSSIFALLASPSAPHPAGRLQSGRVLCTFKVLHIFWCVQTPRSSRKVSYSGLFLRWAAKGCRQKQSRCCLGPPVLPCPAGNDRQPGAGRPWGAAAASTAGRKRAEKRGLGLLQQGRLKWHRLMARATLRSGCWCRGVGGCQQAHGDIKAACVFPPQAVEVRLVSGDRVREVAGWLCLGTAPE